MKVLLVSMPFGALERPSLGLSLLKQALVLEHHSVDVRYLTFPFAELVGLDEYQWLSFEVPYTAFAGDWTFTRALYGPDPDRDRGYLTRVLQHTWQLDGDSVRRILRVRELVEPFLAHCLAAVPWGEYELVGFTSTFEQNIASLALAKRLKSAWPEVVIAFGGANWEAEMGRALHRTFPFVDFACSGEAEQSFPELVRWLAGPGRVPDGTRDGDPGIAGVVCRRNGDSAHGGPPVLLRDLDELPVPDFADYFRDLGQSTIGASLVPTLLFEGSRGCWWGAKSHCVFCGLNGGAMAFRSKSADRALAELDYLANAWRTESIAAVDNILDMRYFRSVLPELARRERRLSLFYEVKSNLTRAQVELLADAGVRRVQPGIESLSDHVLALMRKGTTALRNIQLLKWCREYGVAAEWNILYGFPGETRDDYASMLRMLPAVRFLGPPVACGPIRLDRFSPYFDAPDAFGFRNVRPVEPYPYLYPFGADVVRDIAYYFDYDYTDGYDARAEAAELIAYVEGWRREPERGSVVAVGGPDEALVLVDTRSDAVAGCTELRGPERVAYEYCDQLRSGRGVFEHIAQQQPSARLRETDLIAFLDWLVANRWMVTDGRHYLSLALGAPTPATALPSPAVLGGSPQVPA